MNLSCRRYNVDTGEAQWGAPEAVAAREQHAAACEHGFARLPPSVLVRVMAALPPAPARARAACVCPAWDVAAADSSLLKVSLSRTCHIRIDALNNGK